MKNILLIIVAVSGYYIYSNFFAAVKTDFNPQSSRELFEVLRNGGEVSTDNVITASVSFAKQMCNDGSYQVSGGHSVSSCHEKLTSFHQACENSIFTNKSQVFTNKDVVSGLLKRFVNCVGT